MTEQERAAAIALAEEIDAHDKVAIYYDGDGAFIEQDKKDLLSTALRVLADRFAAPADLREVVTKALPGVPTATENGETTYADDIDGADAVLAAIQASGYPLDLTSFERRVLAERRRQSAVEGWTPEHDDSHRAGELSLAAACYAWAAELDDSVRDTIHLPRMSDTFEDHGWFGTAIMRRLWPWDRSWWKPTTPSRDLEKAGALILAEGDRLERVAARSAV